MNTEESIRAFEDKTGLKVVVPSRTMEHLLVIVTADYGNGLTAIRNAEFSLNDDETINGIIELMRLKKKYIENGEIDEFNSIAVIPKKLKFVLNMQERQYKILNIDIKYVNSLGIKFDIRYWKIWWNVV